MHQALALMSPRLSLLMRLSMLLMTLIVAVMLMLPQIRS